MILVSDGIVLELQQDCLDASVPVSAILRKAKAIASKLDLQELVEWFDQELNGYTCSMMDLPDHRKVGGAPKFWNPYHGWCPIVAQSENWSDLLGTGYLPNPIAQLEEWASKSGGTLTYRYPHVIQEALQESGDMPFEAVMHMSTSQVASALDFVRNKVLDWTLALEKRGITGEGFSFNKKQKEEAVAVTNHIYSSSVGVIGAVSGDANISKFSTASGTLDFEKILSLIDQINATKSALPGPVALALEEPLAGLESGAKEEDSSKVKAAISAMIPVLQGAGGNIVAAGILSAIGLS
jgi:hypothetical protein